MTDEDTVTLKYVSSPEDLDTDIDEIEWLNVVEDES
jgi:hypothetical protein